MKYLIPAVLAFLFAFMLWQIQKVRIVLDYEVIESAVFPSEIGTGQYFIIRLRNAGNTKIENIKLSIQFPNGKISSKSFSNPDLIEVGAETSYGINGLVPLLNPNEILSSTVTVTSNAEIASPKISARAPGVTATTRSDDSMIAYLLTLIYGVLGFALVSMLFSFYSSYKSSKIGGSIVHLEQFEHISREITQSEDKFAERLKLRGEELDDEIKKRKQALEEERKEREAQLESERKEREDDWKRRKEEFDSQIEADKKGNPSPEQLIFALFNRAGLTHRFPEFVGSSAEIKYWKTSLFFF